MQSYHHTWFLQLQPCPAAGHRTSKPSCSKCVQQILAHVLHLSSCLKGQELDVVLEDQRKQKAHLLRLEKACADLAKSQGELSRSHEKMKKREEKR
ncbi:hypothetical protein KY285_000860 [Solanum tuberosum]|nr:hypothetical protein KY285_000860 [Solanum tuberosum]